MLKKTTIIVLSIFFLIPAFCAFLSPAGEIPAPAPTAIENKNELWLFASPEEWPSVVRPGLRGGAGRTLYYIDGLWPVAGTKDSLFFLETKYTNTDFTDANEINLGCGMRSLFFEDKLLLGGNFFYDTRRSVNGLRHHQLGVGIESLSKWIDLRSNFYFPVSKKKHLRDDVTFSFGSRALLKNTTPRFEEPLTGLDYEGGALIPYISDLIETRIYCGGFHYFSKLARPINGIRTKSNTNRIQCFTESENEA